MSEQCEFCNRKFKGGRVRKVVRGKPHIFCSETCFILWRYQRPVPDWEKMYAKYTISVTANIEELIQQQKGEGHYGSERNSR